MSMSGSVEIWKRASQATIVRSEVFKSTLTQIVSRRNRIVHEGDRKRLEKPRTISLEPIDRSGVEDDLDWLEALVNLLEFLANT